MDESSALDGLPRSVRWRVQLGLLRWTPDDPTTAPALDKIYNLNTTLIAQQNNKFHELMEKYVNEEDQPELNDDQALSNANGVDGGGDNVANAGSTADVDPLTAMVMEQEGREKRKQELYLKYRKERARRKRGLATESSRPADATEDDGLDHAALSIIEKDLKRLPHPMETSRSSSSLSSSPSPHLTTEKNNTQTPAVSHPSNFNQEARITNLRELLYIYSQEHPNMGYRQGMHEIASFLLLVLELDEPHHKEKPIFGSILPVAYAMLEGVLEQLQIAYDASVDQSLHHMSLAILSKLYQNHRALHLHLTSSPSIPPPPIYCTRWIRLLFSREVSSYENVLKLWDVFMDEQCKPRKQEQSQEQDNHPGNVKMGLMHVLEIAAASRILLLSNELLDPENSTLDMLMNMPPLEDIRPLTTTLRQLLYQGDLDDPIEVPAGQLHPPSTPSPEKKPQLQPPLLPQQPSSQKEKSVSLKSIRQTLGQRGESIKNKIISTTNEWKTNIQQQRESSSENSNYVGSSPMFHPVGVSSTAQSGGSASADMAAAAAAAIRNHQAMFMAANNKSTETVHFGDPLLNPREQPRHQMNQQVPNSASFMHQNVGSQQSGTCSSPSSTSLPLNQYNHDQSILQRQTFWAQDMRRHIWTVQQFLMFVEQQKSNSVAMHNANGNNVMAGAVTNSAQSGVPREVWEAMADLDRIQQDLQNSTMGGV